MAEADPSMDGPLADSWDGEIEPSKLILRDGTRISLRRAPVASPRLRLLLVHGIAEHSGRWDHVLRFLATHGIDTTAYDLRGHGTSDGARVSAPSFQTHIDDLAEIRDTLKDDRAIYGHSMGGLVALGHAVSSDHSQAPAYVLSAPALHAEVPRLIQLLGRILAWVAPGCRLRMPISGEKLSARPEVGEAVRRDPLFGQTTTAGFGRSFLDAMEEIHGRLSQLTAPTLVIHGDQDALVPPSASEVLGEQPSVERILFPGLRHEMHNESQWRRVLDQVVCWLLTAGVLEDGP